MTTYGLQYTTQKNKERLKIPNGQSEAVSLRKTNHTMAKRKINKMQA